jgi:hypothetical protein
MNENRCKQSSIFHFMCQSYLCEQTQTYVEQPKIEKNKNRNKSFSHMSRSLALVSCFHYASTDNEKQRGKQTKEKTTTWTESGTN